MKRLLCVFLILLTLFMAAVLPALAATSEDGVIDHYIKGYFRKPHDVFSGPGEQYFRAAGGKAMYGSGVVRYYGAGPDGWVLIGYSLNPSTYRLGYIKASFDDLVTKEEGRALSLISRGAVLLQALDFFDDPGISSRDVKPLCRLNQNAEVTYLGEFNQDWTYIEIDASYLGSPARGFVSSGNLLSYAKGPGQADANASGGSVLADGKTEVKWETSSMAWSRKMEITSGAEWKAVSDAPWILLSAEENALAIQLEENKGQESRNGTVLLTSGTSELQINVIQGGAQ